MKRKRKEKNTGSALRNTSKSSVMSPGPTSSQPDLMTEEPAEICRKEDGGRGDHEGKLEALHQNGEEPGPSPGLADGQLNSTNPEVALTAVPPSCHQVEHHAGGDIMVETTTTDNLEAVRTGTTGNPSPAATEETASSAQCPNDADVTATIITETMEVTGNHHSLLFMISNGCEADTCLDQNSNLQVSQKSQPLNATPGLASTPIIPEITSQLQSVVSQSELLVFHGTERRGGYGGHCQDPEITMSSEVPCAQQTPCRGVEVIPSQQNEDPRGAAAGLDLLDSQLLGALEESLHEPGKTPRSEDRERPASQPRTGPPSENNKPFAPLGIDENHIGEHRREMPQATTSTPSPPAAVQGVRGPQERRTEDASATVQGLILELSNINRLVMSAYRELRQKRVRHPPGRAAMSGKRRREK